MRMKLRENAASKLLQTVVRPCFYLSSSLLLMLELVDLVVSSTSILFLIIIVATAVVAAPSHVYEHSSRILLILVIWPIVASSSEVHKHSSRVFLVLVIWSIVAATAKVGWGLSSEVGNSHCVGWIYEVVDVKKYDWQLDEMMLRLVEDCGEVKMIVCLR